jgi:hypothetical protein
MAASATQDSQVFFPPPPVFLCVWQWAGKTIALGTFPGNEADEKCARAKALTRAWRSTMRPKPSRDWVMMELERLGVRVVSGRLGRKAGEEDDEKKSPGSNSGGGGMGGSSNGGGGGMGSWGDNDVGNLMSATRRGSMGLSSMINDGRRGSLGSLVGLDAVDPSSMGRSMGSGFDLGVDAQRRSSGLGGIGGLASAGLGTMGMSVNPNQYVAFGYSTCPLYCIPLHSFYSTDSLFFLQAL